MSFALKLSLAALMLFVALTFLALGALELLDPEDKVGKASRLFFSLAAICAGAAVGVLVH